MECFNFKVCMLAKSFKRGLYCNYVHTYVVYDVTNFGLSVFPMHHLSVFVLIPKCIYMHGAMCVCSLCVAS